MIDEIITKIGLAIKSFGLTLFSPFQWLIDWSPMLGAISLFVAVVIVASFIVRFLPDKLKGLIGYPVLAFAIWTAGRVYQFYLLLKGAKAKAKEDQHRIVPPPAPKPREDGGWKPFWER